MISKTIKLIIKGINAILILLTLIALQWIYFIFWILVTIALYEIIQPDPGINYYIFSTNIEMLWDYTPDDVFKLSLHYGLFSLIYVYPIASWMNEGIDDVWVEVAKKDAEYMAQLALDLEEEKKPPKPPVELTEKEKAERDEEFKMFAEYEMVFGQKMPHKGKYYQKDWKPIYERNKK